MEQLLPRKLSSVTDGHLGFLAVYPFARRAAQVRAFQACVRYGLPSCDRDDLEQDALTHLWQVFAKYDPTRAGVRTFIEVVVSRRFASMLRSQSRDTEFTGRDHWHNRGRK